MFVYLSHVLSEETPLYGGKKAVSLKTVNSINQGSSSNTQHYSFPNHSGTHIDFPLHFSKNGKSINDYLPSDWFFLNVSSVFIQVVEDQIIDEKLITIEKIPEATELLLLVTGFQKHREEEIYWKNNPGLAPSLAPRLKDRCKQLRAIGFDFISLSSFQNRSLGRIAHKEFLIHSDILVMEDMNLASIKDREIQKVIALPLLVDNTDGGPITVIAELADD